MSFLTQANFDRAERISQMFGLPYNVCMDAEIRSASAAMPNAQPKEYRYMASLDEFLAEGRRLEQEYKTSVAAYTGNNDLTLDAKQRVAGEMRTRYDAQVTALRARADAWLAGERVRLANERKKADAVATDNKRQVLGDAVLVQLYARRAALLTPDQLTQWVAESSTDWERMLLTDLAHIELSERQARGGSEGDMVRVQMALNSLVDTADPLRDQEIALRHTAERLNEVDPMLYRERFAETFGVQAEYVKMPADMVN